MASEDLFKGMYEELNKIFFNEFSPSFKLTIDWRRPKLVPIKLCRTKELIINKNSEAYAYPIEEIHDYNSFTHGVTRELIIEGTKRLAHSALGAYNALVLQATGKYGGFCGVSHWENNLYFKGTSLGSSVADPAGFTMGTISYRLNFVGIRNEHLKYLGISKGYLDELLRNHDTQTVAEKINEYFLQSA